MDAAQRLGDVRDVARLVAQRVLADRLEQRIRVRLAQHREQHLAERFADEDRVEVIDHRAADEVGDARDHRPQHRALVERADVLAVALEHVRVARLVEVVRGRAQREVRILEVGADRLVHALHGPQRLLLGPVQLVDEPLARQVTSSGAMLVEHRPVDVAVGVPLPASERSYRRRAGSTMIRPSSGAGGGAPRSAVARRASACG